mgnify:FL=1
MRAMLMEHPKRPLRYTHVATPVPDENQLLIKVHACGICRTDLHIMDGELAYPKLPLIPGHQIVGTVAEKGKNVTAFSLGQRVGVPWLGNSCGHCTYCL